MIRIDRLRIPLVFGLLLMPLAALALDVDDLPAGTVWYLHADLEQMRTSESGRELYAWIEDEALIEVNDAFGIVLDREIDRITAFSDSRDGAVIVAEGAVSEALREKVIEAARQEGDIESRSHGGKDYFLFGDEDVIEAAGASGDVVIDLDDAVFFSFAVKGKFLASSDEARLRSLLDSNGRIAGSEAHGDALFVLSADRKFVQAGMRTGEFADDEDDWDSNILRNTEQAALLVADQGGQIAIEAKLVSSDPALTQSMGNIVSGLISLQSFNSDLTPSLAGILRNTRVLAAGKVLSISTVVPPAVILQLLND